MGWLSTLRSRIYRLNRAVEAARPRGREDERWFVQALEERQFFAANPIVLENLLPGAPQSEWDVTGAGDPTLQGYATDISVDQGQTVRFKIDDRQNAPYHIDIYRMGYYQGLGARKAATIPASQVLRQVQPAPLRDDVTGLVDAGNWSISASWQVPADATSGIYFAKLVREDTGGASHIMFIVRDDDGHSDMLFQTSDTTWQAYNDFGGNSTYAGDSDVAAGRAVKVSYNRPLTIRGVTGGLGAYNSPFHAEYPMVRWLEANGYNVSYFTDVDSHRLGGEIIEHKAFLSVGHDEYWSAEQRANVEAARDAGVNLAFFSGNEVYWKVRWENSIDASGTPMRTMVTYKESKANDGIDPSPVWTGTWRDPRFPELYAANPENSLTGVAYMNDRTNVEIGISMNVPAADGALRFWRNTPIASLAPGQVATIGDRVVGYETDEDLDNGFRPAGLMTMSATTFTTTSHVVVPWGTLVGTGTSTHSVTLYRADSGALVFGAGTVQWSWGLDGQHLHGVSIPDPSMRQATVNLFADMGVQPDTLQPGLVAATASNDASGPATAITALQGGIVNAGFPLTITGTATDGGGGSVAGVEVSTDGGQTWHRATGRSTWSYVWTPSVAGPVTVRARAVDDSGNIGAPSAGLNFTVRYGTTSTTGLVAAYDFNQAVGTTLPDLSGRGNNGTLSGVTWAAGKFGNGLFFPGTQNAWVTIPDANALDLTTGMTLEAWVKPADNAGYHTLLMKERSDGLSYALYGADGPSAPPAGYATTGAGAGNDSVVKGTSALPANVWSHLASTYDGLVLRLFVNGIEVSSQSVSGSLTASNGVLRLGGNSVWGDFFHGTLDDVRIYNRALTQAEIRSDLSTPIGGAADTGAPSASIAGPAAGSQISGTATLSANASDAVAVGGVRFLVNGVAVGVEDVSAPFTASWNTTKWANGTYSVAAVVSDVAGNSTTSATISLVVNNPADTTPSQVRLSEPADGALLAGTRVLAAVASDNVGVVGVRFRINGVDVGPEDTVAPFRFAWNTAAFPKGIYDVVAVARDAAGNLTTSAPIQVTVDSDPPTVSGHTPANDAADVATHSDITVSFSEHVIASSSSVVVKDLAGNTIPGTTTYDATTNTLRFVHRNSFNPSATYTVTVGGIPDLAGNAMAAPVTWSFTTADQIINASIWSDTVVPLTLAGAEEQPVELGVKFRSSYGGFVTGVRFYKGTDNTGSHLGRLWAADGTLLAGATFVNETASGWQSVQFSQPIPISANVTYLVSYYSPLGRYLYTSSYFDEAGIDSGPLHALASGVDGGNGVFRPGAGGGFPTSSFNDTNYWVDVVFTSGVVISDMLPPAVTVVTPAAGGTDVVVNSVVTATFSESVQPATVNVVLKDPAGNVVPATLSYDDGTVTASLVPQMALLPSTNYTVQVSGAADLSNNVMSPVSWMFTTAAAADPDQTPTTSLSLWTGAAVPATALIVEPTPVELGMKFRSDVAGTLTAVRFYKASGGTAAGYLVRLWAADGTLIATQPASGLTAVGWQTVMFDAPVQLQPNVSYVVSFYAPDGRYAASAGYFGSVGTDNGPLHALASGADGGGNGVFRPGAGGGFPASSWNSTNYWVDVILDPQTLADTTPPGVLSQSPAPNDPAVVLTSNVVVRLNEPTQPGTVHVTLRDAAGNVVPATVTYNALSQAVTLDPATDLLYSSTYTVTVADGRDAAGNVMAPVAWSFTTRAGVSIWSDAATPATPLVAEVAPVELGLKFRTDVAGLVTGIRFYKATGSAVSGYLGRLWAADGVLLASGAFSASSAGGWQTLTFDQPIPISANTTYLVSYYTPDGRYVASGGYFSGTGADAGSLHALAGGGAVGGNGVFRAGAGGGFPTGTYDNTNYWVDVVFALRPETTPPSVIAQTPPPNGTGIDPLAANLTATFNESVAPSTISFVLRDGASVAIPASVAYDPGTRRATLTPMTPLMPSTSYTATLSGAQDKAANPMSAPVVWSFTTAADTTAPTVVAMTPGDGSTVSPALPLSVTFSEPIRSLSSLSLRVLNNLLQEVPANLRYDATTRTVTFVPVPSGGSPSGCCGNCSHCPLKANTSYHVELSGVEDMSGNAMAAMSWDFSTGDAVENAKLWPANPVPTIESIGDATAAEVGVRFQADTAGYVMGLRFYKGAGNTGTHVGHLWDADGNLLATATFVNETGSGWQKVKLDMPILLQPGVTYVASYSAPNGRYASTTGYFPVSGYHAGALTATAGATAQPGGGAFADAAGGTNFWVDVVFSNTFALADIAPSITSATPAPASADGDTHASVRVVFDEQVDLALLSVQLRDSANHVVPATVTFDSVTLTATLTPVAGLNPSATYTVSVAAADAKSNVMAPQSWSFTTVADATIFAASVTPAVPLVIESTPVEVGMKFRSDAAGVITGLRFYKAAGNTGTHVGHLWSAGGTLLATATFTNESANGWQTATFASPVSINAGTTYVVSYYTPNGRYSASGGFFASAAADGGPLHGLASGIDGANGVFRGGAGGGFPTQSWNNTNYWVDVVFRLPPPDTTAPGVVAQSPAAAAAAVGISANVAATLSEPTAAGTLELTLRDAGNVLVPATVAYDATTSTITLDPTADLAYGATYTATVSGGRDAAGNVMSPLTWTFTTRADVSVFADAATPAIPLVVESTPLELGMKFRSDVAGLVTGVRFYKGSGNTGTHVGHLWTSTGTLLASVTFTNESASGWQAATFASPVAITANATYVISYYTPDGRYSATGGYFNGAGADTGPLHAPSTGAAGGNGLFRGGNGGGFPNASWNGTNYWVDVVFQPGAGAPPAPGSAVQTSAVDFAAGSGTNIAFTNSAGGEVRLAPPAVQDAFDGTTLGAGWTVNSWASGGGGPTSVGVAGGTLSIAGAEALSTQSVPTTSAKVRGRVAFAAAAYQHFGLATSFASVAGNHWAMFSTAGSTTNLYARVNASGVTQDVDLGARPAGMHNYEVRQAVGGFQFYVDGVLRATVPVTFAAQPSLRAAFSSFGASAIQADSVGLSSTVGTFISSVIDASRLVAWGTATWTGSAPAGASVVIETSTSDAADPNGTWSPWTALGSGAAIASPAARYIRYRVILLGESDLGLVPVLQDIVIAWS